MNMSAEDKQLNLPQREEEILAFWDKEKIFEKSLKKTRRGKLFVFYEGPPTANGNPGIHHFEARAFKDVIPRYKTMRGFFVPRKAGWDTHGLPVEIQVEKELGLKTKKDVERYGIAEFNEKCRESVWRYKEEWDRFTRRIGFWLDLAHPYITYETPYIETLWWVTKKVWEKNLLYQDFKTLPWCPRCQTGLSTHELGMPGAYKKTKDDSVFVRFRIKGKPKESLLIWTTTPWTLSANVAIAANPQIEYTKWKIGDEYVWSATTPPYDSKGAKPNIVEKISGKALIGMEYEPIYTPELDVKIKTAVPYKVVGADFVETNEGTGFVHLAPAFGEEDLQTIKKEYGAKYPILETVELDGTMKKGVIGEGKPVRNANTAVIEDLKKRGLLFWLLPYEHEYPHCWRCDTPLIYYAKNSWWIRMTALKKELIANNQTIDWVPEHIKDGRFGEFLREVRDWAFSRERYWGTPLPVWECSVCHSLDVIGSIDELASRATRSGNTYIAMRHGQSETQLLGIAADSDSKYHLTDKGRKQAERAAEKLKKEKINVIIYSDVLRTKETSQIVARILGVEMVVPDRRIHELNVGIFDGRPTKEYHDFYRSMEEKFVKPVPEGESLSDLKKRVMDFMRETDERFKNKKILIISHEYPIWILDGASRGLDAGGIIALRGKKDDYIGLAQTMRIPFLRLPRDARGSVDLHRPHIDSFEIPCNKCNGMMKRVSEVIDVWFDSGAMPFAQTHFPFDKKEKLYYPADYISEAVDQTRGWFYTLLAVATLLGRGAPYRHVISLGHVLDKNGQKMSKSKGNVVNPQEMIQKYGADTIRWYFYTINPPGEPKRFDEKDLGNKPRGTLATFWNSFVFFDTYVEKVNLGSGKRPKSKNIMDRWVLARLDEIVLAVTDCLEKYDITGAARILDSFIVEDFSRWYLRRSRRRFQKPETKEEKDEAASVMGYALLTLVSLFAPFTPFLSEVVWRELRKKTGAKDASIHLKSWPKAEKIGEREKIILSNMKTARELATLALAERAKAALRVRQPLSLLEIPKASFQNLDKDTLGIIKDEVNVKNIFSGEILRLDIVLTRELTEEGWVREILRNVQEMRKELGFHPTHRMRLQVVGNSEFDDIIGRWKAFIVKEAGAKLIVIGGKKIFKIEREFSLDGREVWVGVDKI
ncbi:MAG: class I tRNA ligase family protein [bacterium]|nr:class I tRNA ligase family protein [bacterium]